MRPGAAWEEGGAVLSQKGPLEMPPKKWTAGVPHL